MIVLLSANFQGQLDKYRGKQTVDIGDFFDRVVQRVLSDPLYLCRPYMKLKIPYKGHALRLVVRYDEEKNTLIPLYMTNKVDKQYGENMIWSPEMQEKVKLCMRKVTDDLNQGRVTLYTV